jgi:putative ABC transport system permease protein
MALGARRFDLIRLILRDAFLLVDAGIGGGVLLTFWGTRFGATMLPEVSARDPILFGGVAVLLALVAMVAAFLLARRASLLDPNWALRSD